MSDYDRARQEWESAVMASDRAWWAYSCAAMAHDGRSFGLLKAFDRLKQAEGWALARYRLALLAKCGSESVAA